MVRFLCFVPCLFLFVFGKDALAGDSLRLRKNQLWFKTDMINSGNYFWIGGGIGLGYTRSINRYIDAGGELGGNFGPSLYGNGDVYGTGYVFTYKALADLKPVCREKHIFKIGLGFAGSIIEGDNLFGICNKFTWQVNRKRKTVVGLYAYNDLYFDKAWSRPLDIFGLGFFVGGRY